MKSVSSFLTIMVVIFQIYSSSVSSFSLLQCPSPSSTMKSSLYASVSSSGADYDNDKTPAQQIEPSTVQAKDLRSIKVTNSNGEMVPLGDAMGNDTSIVVFLRHLGCSWCWSYVEYWREALQQQNNDDNTIVGPIFVSIGDEIRLNQFLDKNPDIPKETMFVDGYDFGAYKQAGFGRFDEKPASITDAAEPKPLRFKGGVKGWWTFLSNFMQLAPVTEDMKFPEMFTPEGLFWVGGTFVVRGDDIIYRWDDRISGDHPEAADVMAIAQQMAKQND